MSAERGEATELDQLGGTPAPDTLRAATQQLQGSVGRTLARAALPMLIGTLFIGTQSIMDTYFVAQLGSTPLSALGFISPVTMVAANLLVGAGTGLTSCIARAAGARDARSIGASSSAGVALALLSGLCGSVLGLVTWRAGFGLLGARGAILEHIGQYMIPWSLSLTFQAAVFFGSAALRGLGHAGISGGLLVAAALLTLAFEPLLIFGAGPIPGLGLAGAGIAVMLGYAVAMVLTVLVLARRGFAPGREALASLAPALRAVLAVSVPAALAYGMMPLGNVLATLIVAGHGTGAVAAFGVAGRLLSFVMLLPLALAAALAPFVGLNWGAQRVDRAREGTALMLKTALVWGVVIWSLMAAGRAALAASFSQDDLVRAPLLEALLWVPLQVVPAGMLVVTAAAFNAIGQAPKATFANFLRCIGLGLPFAFLGSRSAGLTGLLAGLVIASVPSLALALVWLARCLRVEPAQKPVEAGCSI